MTDIFYPGQRVKCIKAFQDRVEAVGKTGTIVVEGSFKDGDYYWPPMWYTVVFDEHIRGHSANGAGENGFCWNMPGNYLELIEVDIGDLEDDL